VVAGEDRSEGLEGAEGRAKPAAASSVTNRKKKRRFPLRLRLSLLRRAPLIPELERYAEQHPELHPDRYLIALVWHKEGHCDDLFAALTEYCGKMRCSISTERAEAILVEAENLEPQVGSYTLAAWLGIPKALRIKYNLRTIAGCDTTPEQDAAERKLADALRKREKRDKPPRAFRIAAAKARRAEIAASGVTKSQWYRREKAKREAMRLSCPRPFLLNAADTRVASGTERAARRPAEPQPTPPQPRVRQRQWDVRRTDDPDVDELVWRRA
jgi:hypothetical protein